MLGEYQVFELPEQLAGTERMPHWVSQLWLEFEFVAVTRPEINGEAVYDALTGKRLCQCQVDGLLVSARIAAMDLFLFQPTAGLWIRDHFPEGAYLCFSRSLCRATGVTPRDRDLTIGDLEAALHHE